MLAGFKRLPVQVLVLLHVGEVDKEIELFTRQHLVNVRVMVRHIELLRLVTRALRPDVAQTHHVRVRTFGQHRQIGMGYTPAPDHADSDSLCFCADDGP